MICRIDYCTLAHAYRLYRLGKLDDLIAISISYADKGRSLALVPLSVIGYDTLGIFSVISTQILTKRGLKHHAEGGGEITTNARVRTRTISRCRNTCKGSRTHITRPTVRYCQSPSPQQQRENIRLTRLHLMPSFMAPTRLLVMMMMSRISTSKWIPVERESSATLEKAPKLSKRKWEN